MFYDNELHFLIEIFKKCHIGATVTKPSSLVSEVFDTEPDLIFGINERSGKSISDYVGKLDKKTLYKLTDTLELCYVYFLLPDTLEEQILFIGPFLGEATSDKLIFELEEKNNIPPAAHSYLSEHLRSIPVLKDSSHLFVMIETFCERIWQTPSFPIIDVKNELKIPPSPINSLQTSESFDDSIAFIKTMEKRYSFENELMDAVSKGQSNLEAQLFESYSTTPFEKRTSDQLRNAKNYSVILNTLLRKAAEKGGVHPVYLNKTSSSFAVKIEHSSTLSEISELSREMFSSYCRLVRRHSLKNYSLIVQKSILLINSDLSADLSLSLLASNQGVTPGYLSTIFKRETGKTVSEYIKDKRIKYAKHLLGTTHLQVQTVALHCGIMDLQYFSKIFKKHTGKTPKEYRASLK